MDIVDEPVEIKEKTETCGSGDSRGCAVSSGLVVAIYREKMGEGDEELGKILIKAFINSLTELPTPPKSVIFVNTGVLLASDGANTIDDLKKLEQSGTTILSCGICVEYYGIQDKIAVGSVAFMSDVIEIMASAGNIISI